jgi:hypothetical protein
VRNARLGTGLGKAFLKDSEANVNATTPDYAVVLMRRHGYTTHGRDIETAVSLQSSRYHLVSLDSLCLGVPRHLY